MSMENHPTTKHEKFKLYTGICLQENNEILRGFPIKESAIELGMGCLMLLMAALNFVTAALRFGLSLLAALSGLLAKGVARIMPGPKVTEDAK